MSRALCPAVLSLAIVAASLAFEARAEDAPPADAAHAVHAAGTEPSSMPSDGHDGSAAVTGSDPGHTAQQAGSDSPLPADGEATPPPETGANGSDLVMAGDMETLEPYKLVRSLQYVQDAVVQGDHSAMEMQRFLLGVIDSRLRMADQRVFDDPRNVDAALIYAMSGGNPETLDILAVKDKFGNFDNEVTTVLRAYLNGRAGTDKTSLAEVVKLYRDTEIGPYLTLVAANVTAALNDDGSLALFDWARLTAPGTLVEEAALRRSLFIAARKNMVDQAIKYAQLYARRFINSPYAGQYADLLVDLVVLNYGKVGDERLSEILSFMDRPRKREVYLRIARKAVITGLRDLAVFASGKAEALLSPTDQTPQALADLYSGMANIPTDRVGAVLDGLNAVSERQLPPRDRALREAARIVAAEVMRKPDPASLTQAFSPMVQSMNALQDGETGPPAATPEANADVPTAEGAASSPGTEVSAEDEAFRGYVSDRKQTLERIDKLLEGVEGGKGS